MSSTETRANPQPGPSVGHLYDCTHVPCRCPTAHDLLAVFTDAELAAELAIREVST